MPKTKHLERRSIETQAELAESMSFETRLMLQLAIPSMSAKKKQFE